MPFSSQWYCYWLEGHDLITAPTSGNHAVHSIHFLNILTSGLVTGDFPRSEVFYDVASYPYWTIVSKAFPNLTGAMFSTQSGLKQARINRTGVPPKMSRYWWLMTTPKSGSKGPDGMHERRILSSRFIPSLMRKLSVLTNSSATRITGKTWMTKGQRVHSLHATGM